MTTGTVIRARVKEAHRIPPVPNVGFGKDSGKRECQSSLPPHRQKNPSPKTPNTIEGTPAKLLTAIRTKRTITPCFAYSFRYTAASTPKGTTAILIIKTMNTVPKIAGKMPPSVLASRGSSLTMVQIFRRYVHIFAISPYHSDEEPE